MLMPVHKYTKEDCIYDIWNEDMVADGSLESEG
jgi:hypothetical protein